MANSTIKKILVLINDVQIQETISTGFGGKDFLLEFEFTAKEALNKIQSSHFDVLILDAFFLETKQLRILTTIREIAPNILIIVVSAPSERELAIDAIREGAHDFFLKPFDIQEIIICINNALSDQKQKYPFDFPEIVGESEPIKWMKAFIDKTALSESNVFISGESGTGKDLVAGAIHCQSKKAARPLIKLRCAGQNEEYFANKLFGIGNGSEGEVDKIGMAHAGAILLDEISDMSLEFQGIILRLLEESENTSISGKNNFESDVRIISTTNTDIKHLIEKNKFREDLYYRLNVISIHVPPLRDRLEDIPLLTRHILAKLNSKLGLSIDNVSEEGLQVLMAYEWPGNVRELENIIERAAIMSNGKILDSYEVEMMIKASIPGARTRKNFDENEYLNENDGNFKEIMNKIEKKLIVKTLIKTNGVQKDAAEQLGLGAKNLWKKIQKHGIDVNQFTSGNFE